MKIKKIIKNLIFIIQLALIANTVFCLNLTTVGLDKALLDTYLADDETKDKEIIEVIEYFNDNFINENMSDFEKEIQIIKFLVETVEYDNEIDEEETFYIDDSYKAYGALINHKAVCSGYAKAFDILAKSCGLSSTVVTGEATNTNNESGPHAWNQIYLDGEWYNVDVTWEDPITNMKLGFNQLLNNYINCTDFEFEKNHFRETGNTCTATKYGKNVVSYYLNTGVVDLNANVDSLRKIYEEQINIYNKNKNSEELEKVIDKLLILGAKYDDNTNYFENNDDMQIIKYIIKCIENEKNVITVVTGPNTKGKLIIDKNQWLTDYMEITKECTIQKYYAEDEKYDTRIFIFSWKD